MMLDCDLQLGITDNITSTFQVQEMAANFLQMNANRANCKLMRIIREFIKGLGANCPSLTPRLCAARGGPNPEESTPVALAAPVVQERGERV